jgi:hypothetical protein
MKKKYSIFIAVFALLMLSCHSFTHEVSYEEMDEYGFAVLTAGGYSSTFVYKSKSDLIVVWNKHKRKIFHCNKTVQKKIIDFFDFQFDRKNLMSHKRYKIFGGYGVMFMMIKGDDRFTLDYDCLASNSDVSKKYDELIKYLKARKILEQNWGISSKK